MPGSGETGESVISAVAGVGDNVAFDVFPGESVIFGVSVVVFGGAGVCAAGVCAAVVGL